jgi:hypothetical protein
VPFFCGITGDGATTVGIGDLTVAIVEDGGIGVTVAGATESLMVVAELLIFLLLVTGCVGGETATVPLAGIGVLVAGSMGVCGGLSIIASAGWTAGERGRECVVSVDLCIGCYNE